MSNDIKVKVNLKGVREVFRAQKVIDDLEKRVKKIAQRANQGKAESNGYVGDVRQSKYGTIAMCKTNSIYARRDNAKNNTLLKSLDAGRGN
jgi:hypothetical protein